MHLVVCKNKLHEIFGTDQLRLLSYYSTANVS